MTMRSKRPEIGDRVAVDIARIVPRGFGLGFAAGLTLLVPLSAPGDRLIVRLTESKGNAYIAEIEEIIAPGPSRIDPPCPYFGTCGGCNFQQLDYSAQLDAKVGIVRDALHRIGKIDLGDMEIVPSPREFGYRMRAQWHADRDRRAIGYYRRSSHDVVDIEHCPILEPELDKTLAALRGRLDWRSIPHEKTAIEAAAGDHGSVSVFAKDLFERPDEITATVGSDRFIFSARSFFQGNLFVAETLVRLATEGSEGENAFDLYSGVGLFTLPLARRFRHVKAVEENGLAVDFAERGARSAGLANISFVRGRADRFVAAAPTCSADFVLLDPPRAGGSKDTIRQISRVVQREISYVSCEPSILARDLRVLLDNGFAIEKITALDMFPQTHHVETVVRLRRVD